MIKLGICTLFFILGITKSFSQMDCEKIRKGNFIVYNSNGTISKIKRTKNYQIEKSKGVVIKDKITWIDNCSYYLVPKKIKDKTDLIKNEVLKFNIIEIGVDYYIVAVSGGSLHGTINSKVYFKQ